MPTIQAQTLIDLSRAIFIAAGAPDDIAQVVAGALVKANLMGHDSHGVLRVARYVDRIRQQGLDPAARPKIARRTGGVAVVDGQWGFGQIGARFGTELVRDIARTDGTGCVVLSRVNHIGRVGEYAEMLAKEGLASMLFTGSSGLRGAVAPFGGQDRIFGTNPITWSVPVKEGRPPLVVDFATAGTAEGKLAVAASKGVTVPEGLLLDREGNPSVDPNSFYEGGALLPFGGHKGYGLSLMVQIMGGALGGLPEEGKFGNPTLIIAWSIDAFVPAEQFQEQVEALLQRIKDSRPAPGFEEVLLPGEPEARTLARRTEEGIPVPEPTWQGLLDLAQELGAEADV